jgi:dipeptidyl aminopeptidase/acylaminoacyl peptidase
LTILAAACGGGDGGNEAAVSTSPATVEPELLSQFDYDSSAPLDVKEVKSDVKDGAVVHDITYAGPEGRIDAFLVTPEGDGPYPAVEFMPGAPGAKYTFYTEAIELAKAGVVSLLPNPAIRTAADRGRRRLRAVGQGRDRPGGQGDATWHRRPRLAP